MKALDNKMFNALSSFLVTSIKGFKFIDKRFYPGKIKILKL